MGRRKDEPPPMKVTCSIRYFTEAEAKEDFDLWCLMIKQRRFMERIFEMPVADQTA
jgi:hypothetical protein